MIYFYDFETFDLISSTDANKSEVKKILFSYGGTSLYYLSGESVKHIKWEPFNQLDIFHTRHGTAGDFIINQNKIITAGTKVMTV